MTAALNQPNPRHGSIAMSENLPDVNQTKIGQTHPTKLEKGESIDPKMTFIRQESQQIIASFFRGPLPPPAELKKYNEIVPDGAERLFQDFEKNSEHKRQTERIKTLGIIITQSLGLIFAFIFAITGLGVSVYCATIGQTWLAAILGGTTIASVVAAFLYEKHSPPKNAHPKK